MRQYADIWIDFNGRSLLCTVQFGFVPGRPAYTPRGEYAPIDPPEPPEVDVQKAWVKADGNEFELQPELVSLLAEDDDVIEKLIEKAEGKVLA